MATKTLIPFETTHPGTLIKDELELREDLTQKDLAVLLGVKPSFLNEIVKGKRPVTADIAILLEKSLGISADYWMKFQSQFEIDNAKIKEKNIAKIKNIEIWKIVSQYVPIKYFGKKGYLTNDLFVNISIIQSIYSVKSIDGLVNKFSEKKFAFFKKSEKLQLDNKNIFAWTSLAEYEAERKKTNTFHSENLPQLNNELREIFYKNKNTIELVEKKLSQYGIKFLMIDKLEKTPIDGYSFWSKNNPAIALTLRHNRIDNLAFTILHEIGHIALHLKENKEIKFLDLTKIEENEIENAANQYAQENLIPSNYWDEFLKNHTLLNDEIISKFSNKHRIHPAIILGRACFEMNHYGIKTKIDKKLN
ncbi:MAG: HigA family addiction module antidote protein [Bacteroidia bacterium]|nr:HigA family addiction module antidote protein [Bacteroidia bacterium]MCF8425174.1 HigA family addiction module antidote protein [Bacteroidia bacterium]MCF8447681.1 HigA family addiction module antidote protein [Bacteroidia bacterium]